MDSIDIKKLVDQARSRTSYKHVTVITYSTKGGVAHVEVRSTGRSWSVTDVLGTLTRLHTYPGGKQVEVPLINLASENANRRVSDDLILIEAEGANKVNLFTLLAEAGYVAISEEVAVRVGSWLAGWIDSMFSTPLNKKAYISAMLNAAVYSDWCQKDIDIYVCDFTKVGISIFRNGKRYDLPGGSFGGQDGSGLCSGPSLRTMQFRLASLNGAVLNHGADQVTDRDSNLFAKGLVAGSFLKSVEGDRLVFDKEHLIKKDTIVLDINCLKGNFADKCIKKVVKNSSNTWKVNFLEGKLLVEITKISSDPRTSGTYQWASCLQLPGVEDHLDKFFGRFIKKATPTKGQAKLIEEAEGVYGKLNATVLMGEANRNQILSYLVSMLPPMRTRKAVMVKASSTTIEVEGEVFSPLGEGEMTDHLPAKELVVGRNPMLTPTGIQLLKNKNSYFAEIYNIEDAISIFTDLDSAKIQGDDDGDDNVAEPDTDLVELVRLHAQWVKKSIFKYGVAIENDKSNQVKESSMDFAAMQSEILGDSGLTYILNKIQGVEQPCVGLCSDIGVNILSQIQWMLYDGKTPNAVFTASKSFLFNKQGAVFQQVLEEEGEVWVPRTMDGLKALLLYFVAVWFTQTSIDWKKRAYILLSSFCLLDSYSWNPQAGNWMKDWSLMDQTWSTNKNLLELIKQNKVLSGIDLSVISLNVKNKFLEDLISTLVKVHDQENSIPLFALLGGWIGSKNAMVLTEIEQSIPGLSSFTNPQTALFWDVEEVNLVFTYCMICCKINPLRKWKGLAKNAFVDRSFSKGKVVLKMADKKFVEDTYNQLLLDTSFYNGLNMFLRISMSKHMPARLLAAFSDINKIHLNYGNWLASQSGDVKQQRADYLKLLKEAKGRTHIVDTVKEDHSLKSFQKFLINNNIEFTSKVFMLLLDVNADLESVVAGLSPLVTTMLAYQKLLDDPVEKKKHDTEKIVMNVLDGFAWQVFKSMLGERHVQVTLDKSNFSTWFAQGWKDGMFKQVNNAYSLDEFIQKFIYKFSTGLDSYLANSEILALDLNDDDVKEIVITNITRTLRSLDYWKVAREWSELKQNSANWYKANGFEVSGNFTRGRTTTSPYQLVEKLILEKGWAPADLTFQINFMRSVLMYHFKKDVKVLKERKLESYTMTGETGEFTLSEVIKKVIGNFEILKQRK